MKKKIVLFLITHAIMFAVGFVGGIYTLPILMAPDAPTTADLARAGQNVLYSGSFKRDLIGSDFAHWGEGEVLVGSDYISFAGELSPGPDYRLYLSPVPLETAEQFNQQRVNLVQVGRVDTFENFIVPIPDSIDPADYRTIIIWCEAFGKFITSANYR